MIRGNVIFEHAFAIPSYLYSPFLSSRSSPSSLTFSLTIRQLTLLSILSNDESPFSLYPNISHLAALLSPTKADCTPALHQSQFATPEQQAAHRQATTTGGIRGLVWATGLSLPIYYALSSRSQFYRSLPPAAKSFGFVIIGVPMIFISAEKAGEGYDKSQWTGIGKQELDFVKERERDRWDRLRGGEKVAEWAKANRYGIIGCS